MGAGFRAASISTLFRVKEILVKDRPVYDINVIHDSEPIGINNLI